MYKKLMVERHFVKRFASGQKNAPLPRPGNHGTFFVKVCDLPSSLAGPMQLMGPHDHPCGHREQQQRDHRMKRAQRDDMHVSRTAAER